MRLSAAYIKFIQVNSKKVWLIDTEIFDPGLNNRSGKNTHMWRFIQTCWTQGINFSVGHRFSNGVIFKVVIYQNY